MTPAEALDELLPRWRATLPAEYPAEVVDGFVRRHRSVLERLLGQVLGVRRLRRGALPRSPEDFSAVRLLAERQRQRHVMTDKEIARHLKKRRAKLSEAAKDPAARENLRRRFEEYVVVRAEALLMGQMGWDAVPLLLRRPLLAVYSASSVVMVHRHGDEGPEVAIFPGLEGSADDLRSDLEIAHEAATAIVEQIGDRGPEPVWARARGRGAAVLRGRAHFVCRHCGARLREPGPHYAIGTIECPAGAGECVDAETDAEETRLRHEEARRRLAENPVPVFTPPDRSAERAQRQAEQRLRREDRARAKEEAERQRQEKAAERAKAREGRDLAARFESGELPKTAEEVAAYQRFVAAKRPDETLDDEALIAWVADQRDALLGRRPDIDIQEAAITAEYDFVRLRAEALILRALGHDAIPLMLRRPTLTVVSGDAVIVHRHFPPELVVQVRGEVSTHDYFTDAEATIDTLAQLRQVHAHIDRLRAQIGGMDMEVLAPALWQAARDVATTVKTADPEGEGREALDVLLAPEPVDRFGRMVHETRWASRAAAIRLLERAGFRFIQTRAAATSGWPEGYWSRFPMIAVVKASTVQVTAAL